MALASRLCSARAWLIGIGLAAALVVTFEGSARAQAFQDLHRDRAMMEITAPQWIGVLIGFGIGSAAELWGIANPESIIRLARWKDRLFIACVSVGGSVAVLVVYGLYVLGIQMHFGLKDFYLWGILLGGIFFGTGMAISGYFPGSEWMALGEGRRDALYAVPAGLMGAFAWTLLSATGFGQWLVHTNNRGEILITGKTIAESSPRSLFLVAIVFACR